MRIVIRDCGCCFQGKKIWENLGVENSRYMTFFIFRLTVASAHIKFPLLVLLFYSLRGCVVLLLLLRLRFSLLFCPALVVVLCGQLGALSHQRARSFFWADAAAAAGVVLLRRLLLARVRSTFEGRVGGVARRIALFPRNRIVVGCAKPRTGSGSGTMFGYYHTRRNRRCRRRRWKSLGFSPARVVVDPFTTKLYRMWPVGVSTGVS